MIEDIRALSAQYAADPSSLIFLRLAEALRLRGQTDAAHKVAVQGLTRYPHLPDAHDLFARILADQQDYANAFDEWDTVLRLVPQHIGAHKGIGFLYYRAGEPELAIDCLNYRGCRSETGQQPAPRNRASRTTDPQHWPNSAWSVWRTHGKSSRSLVH